MISSNYFVVSTQFSVLLCERCAFQKLFPFQWLLCNKILEFFKCFGQLRVKSRNQFYASFKRIYNHFHHHRRRCSGCCEYQSLQCLIRSSDWIAHKRRDLISRDVTCFNSLHLFLYIWHKKPFMHILKKRKSYTSILSHIIGGAQRSNKIYSIEYIYFYYKSEYWYAYI